MTLESEAPDLEEIRNQSPGRERDRYRDKKNEVVKKGRSQEKERRREEKGSKRKYTWERERERNGGEWWVWREAHQRVTSFIEE